MSAAQARELLGLPTGADAHALGRAYRAAVKAVHPDLGGGDPERLRQVIEAHKVLKTLAEAPLLFAPAPQAEASGPSLSLKITLREALHGARRRLAAPGGQWVEVRLPKGLRSGDVVRVRRAGGDLMVGITLEAPAGISIHGGDLWIEVTASARQIKRGARLEVDTPRGRRALRAPEGAADGRPIRLKGQGLPAHGPHAAGDLFLKLTLEPGAEEPASKKLLRRFSARWAA